MANARANWVSGPPAVVVEAVETDASPFIAAMERRNLTTALTTVRDAKAEWIATATAVVVIAGPRKLGVAKDKVGPVIQLALDYGTHIVVAVSAEEIDLYQDWLKVEQERPVSKAGGLADGTIALLISEPRTVANHLVSLRRWPMAATSLVIEPSGFPKDLGVLVQRAFNGFDRITLTEQPGGRTSQTYRVDAAKTGALRPLPFLMKIGKRGKIAEEYTNFVNNVSDYVPFSSRPDLVRERCLLGSQSGVLVAHFIEHSEPLHDLVLRVPSPRLLHSVFEDLLRGWWRLGERDTQATDKRVLAGLEEWCDPAGKPDRRDALLKHSAIASSHQGGLHPPDEIGSRLLAVAVPHRRSLIHGDLHAGNIHVRGTEPFLIDFGSVNEGPILADPAMLEASLVLAVGIECTDPAAQAAWEQLTDSELYPPTGVREVPRRDPPAGLTILLQRLWEALRVIRMHVVAMRLSPVEYPTLMAAAFMRQASFDDAKPAQRTKAVARLYSVASRIVDGIP